LSVPTAADQSNRHTETRISNFILLILGLVFFVGLTYFIFFDEDDYDELDFNPDEYYKHGDHND
jgi:hypothetical protein